MHRLWTSCAILGYYFLGTLAVLGLTSADSFSKSPCSGEWEKAAKDEIAKYKKATIDAANAHADSELECVEKLHKLALKKNELIERAEKKMKSSEEKCNSSGQEIQKWKHRAERAERMLKQQIESAESERRKHTKTHEEAKEETAQLKKLVQGWHKAAALVAQWTKKEHDDRRAWMKQHAAELGRLSVAIKKEKSHYSSSFLSLIKNGVKKPSEFVSALQSLFKDAQKRRSSRDQILAQKENLDFENSLKELERDAPPGFLRGQGSSETISQAIQPNLMVYNNLNNPSSMLFRNFERR
jgi:hypothetical protein